MGVASLATKRHLESGSDSPPSKLAKLTNNNVDASILLPSSSELVTTSILARTLLTASSPVSCPDPLESLKSTLEALPAPAILNSPPFKPIDPLDSLEIDPLEWNNPAKATPVVNGIATDPPVHSMNPSISSLTSLVDHQLLQGSGILGSSPHEVITEDESGKSYFNLGATSDLTRVGSSSSSRAIEWHGGDDEESSSCDSISSEDLFNSGEEFDASEDDDEEDELCTYKQQRSTVLHLSLCKLNKFRTVRNIISNLFRGKYLKSTNIFSFVLFNINFQNCVEPSLHRSVLICNTLRHIEQEIRKEDEADESLKSRERLPSFWPAPQQQPPPPPQQQTPPPCFASPQPSSSHLTATSSHLAPLPSMPPHDPYLTPYSTPDSAYSLQYDYQSRPTPFHAPSYDYSEDLLPAASSTSTPNTTPAATSLLDVDSGYSDGDLDLSSYYYTPSIPLHTDSFPSRLPPASELLQPGGGATSDYSSSNSPPSSPPSPSPPPEVSSQATPLPASFPQQESQCGLESRRSDLRSHSNHYSNHHQIPMMDSLISPSYSSSSL